MFHSLKKSQKSRLRSKRLNLDTLESREVPAGLVTAAIDGNGILTLVGDDFDNTVTITKTATDVTITPDATTSVNGGLNGVAFSFAVAPIAIQAFMQGGNDTVSIGSTGDFLLPGAIGINLGDGDNTLNLVTSGKLSVFAMFIVGGDGTNNVTVQGGANSQVTGTTGISYGFGQNTTTLQNIAFNGLTGVGYSSAGVGTLNLTDTTVSKTLTTNFGTGQGTVNFNTSNVGAYTGTGRLLTATATNTTVRGNISMTGFNGPTLNANGLTTSGFVSVVGTGGIGTATTNWSGTNSVGGNLGIKGESAALNVGTALANSLSVAGSVFVTGARASDVTLSQGTFSATNLSVTATRGEATFTADGAAATLTGSATVSGVNGATIDQTDGVLTAVNLTATSTQGDANFKTRNTASSLNLSGDISLTGASAATASLSTGTIRARVLSVVSGNGVAQINSSAPSVIFSSNVGANGAAGTDVNLNSPLFRALSLFGTSGRGTVDVTASGASTTLLGTAILNGTEGATLATTGGTFTSKGATINSSLADANFTASGGGTAINGPLSITGNTLANLQHTAGGLSTGNVALQSNLGDATFASSGSTLTVNGFLSVIGQQSTSVNFNTSGLAEVKGNIGVLGGPDADTFTTNAKFKADLKLTLNLGDGNNSVTIGDGTAAVPIIGPIVINTGTGTDTVSLNRVAVTGTTSIITGLGADVLSVDNGSVFTSAFGANLGNGDDTFNIAQSTGSTAAVRFNGLTTLLGFNGNDTLRLGRANNGAAGGDALSRAVFAVSGSAIFLGFGANIYDSSLAQFSGPVTIAF